MSSETQLKSVEEKLKEVYNFCPPTKTLFRSTESRDEYKKFWGSFFSSFGVGPERFAGRRLLDMGCGSCEKASFYHDWGAHVTAIDMTAEVLKAAAETIGDRDIRLVHTSLFDFEAKANFDTVVIDGVTFITADTGAALRKATDHLAPGGTLVFSIANVWGTFWWFRYARWLTGLLGGRDFHSRAKWGRRFFLRSRKSQEGTEETCQFYRSEKSWAYDWFGPPAYHLHSPGDLLGWLKKLDLTHIGSAPCILSKENPRTPAARLFRKVTGSGPFLMGIYWLLNNESNMAYVAAAKSPPRGRY